MTRVLLTGGTGFVGRQILYCLLKRDCKVRMAVRTSAVVAAEVEQVIVSDLFVAPQHELERLCSGIDIVIHSAWYSVPGEYQTAHDNLSCLSGTLRLAQAAITVGVPRFVGIGTCFEYDLSTGYLRTDTPLLPTTLYGACKLSAFRSLSKLMARENRSMSWCRLFYLYGEAENERRLVPYIRAQLAAGKVAQLTSGKQIRDYIDVKEAGRQISNVALGNLEGPINICSGLPITIANLALSIADEYGRRDLLAFGAKDDVAGEAPCVVGEPAVIDCYDAKWRIT